MPFLRFARDSRGYESTYLVHTYRSGRKTVTQVLYWFRTPPHVKVGRLALDEGTIHAIEAAYPDLEFDWETLLKQRPPPPREFERHGGGRRRAAAEPGRKRRTSTTSRQKPRSVLPVEAPGEEELAAEANAGASPEGSAAGPAGDGRTEPREDAAEARPDGAKAAAEEPARSDVKGEGTGRRRRSRRGGGQANPATETGERGLEAGQ